ncbi:MAG: YggS family pyridoxal phosphate-dependent enzyme [Flavisolibacter sp.]
MLVNKDRYSDLLKQLNEYKVQLVAVSKTKSVEAIKELYELGQRDFGENYVQELSEKYLHLPQDIQWHFIGHLQTNKVRLIASFIYLIHGVDSYRLLKEIDKQAGKYNRKIYILLQIHIAKEETKFGLDSKELNELLDIVQTNPLNNVIIKGLMGMASLTGDMELVRQEFRNLRSLFDSISSHPALSTSFSILSMGMSNDYKLALQEKTTMVRIGSLLFGERNY